MADNNTNIPAADTPAPTAPDDPIERNITLALEAQDGTTTTTDAPTETGTPTEVKPAESAAPANNKDSNSTGSDATAQQQPPKDGAQAQQPSHGAKDLVDKDGKVIAKGGAERRFYEQRETARQQAQHWQQQYQGMQQQLQSVQQELNSLKQTSQQIAGADPNDVRIGAQIVSDLKRDPVGTMKKLLAEVVAQGHNIDAIGTGVDTLAIQRMIDERLPRTDTTAAPTDEQLLAEAQTEVNNFYNAHPDARPHDALLGRMLRDHPTLDLQSAYFQLKYAFAEKGYDWSLTLEDNLQAAGASPTPTPTPTPTSTPGVNGSGKTPANAAPIEEVKVAHEDTDMGDIVRSAMRDSGMNV